MKLSTILDLAALILAAVAGLRAFRQATTSYRLILLQVWIALLTEFAGATFYRVSNVPMYNVYMLMESALLMRAAFLSLEKPGKWPFAICFSAVLIFWTWNVYKSGWHAFQLQAFLLYAVLLLMMYIVVLYNSAMRWKTAIGRNPDLWICAGMIVFYACIVPYLSTLGLQNSLSPAQRRVLHFFAVDLLHQLRYLLIAVGFFLLYHQPIQSKGHEK